jgi:hypothetical protein
MEEYAETAVAAAMAVMNSHQADGLDEVERLGVRRPDDPLEPPAQVLHASAGQPAGAGGHGPQLLPHPPFCVRRPPPPRRVPHATAVAVHQPPGHVEQGNARVRVGRPLPLVLEHDPPRRGYVRAAEACRHVEHQQVIVVSSGGVMRLLEEEADEGVPRGR